MSSKPIFMATHPRACSTAFERVFMTCRDRLTCVHEPFGDAWYFGPERTSDRFAKDEASRIKSGFSETTYNDIFEDIDNQAKDGKRLFIKDMAQYLIPPPTYPKETTIAPSLVSYRRGVGTNGVNGTNGTNGVHETNGVNWIHSNGTNGVQTNGHSTKEHNNPTVVPDALMRKYHFTFLIRHPRYSIPSYFRCTVPPLAKMTGFSYFDPSEAGYKELRQLFDYLVQEGHIGPKIAGAGERIHGANANAALNGNAVHQDDDEKLEICVIDADDLLDAPYAVIEAYCKSIGLEYSPDMLKWDDDESQKAAKEAFEKWTGFHEDAIDSKELRPRTHKKEPKSDEQLIAEWTEKFGEENAQIMMKTVEENVADYEYLKQFALKV